MSDTIPDFRDHEKVVHAFMLNPLARLGEELIFNAVNHLIGHFQMKRPGINLLLSARRIADGRIMAGHLAANRHTE